jgi:feruloyl esterase
VATFNAIYAGASTEDGEQLYPGYTKSDPAGTAFFGPFGWAFWITGSQAPNAPGTPEPWVAPEVPPLQFGAQDQFLKFFVFSDPTYDSRTFDLNNPSDLAQAAAVSTRGGAAGTNPDLSAFKNRGGKLMLYHGWSDPAVTPLETVQYYTAVVRRLHGGWHRTQHFARLFMVPGMLHCIGSGGSGPNVFDPLPALKRWVEDGVAPDQIIASCYLHNDVSTGVVTRTMPLCPYPAVAVFMGGDVNVAANWTCTKRHAREGDE